MKITVEIEVPEWARYVATDGEGKVSVFNEKPFLRDDSLWWYGDMVVCIAYTIASPDWRDSLVELQQVERGRDGEG